MCIRDRNVEDREARYLDYRRIRRDYARHIYQAKKQSWQTFVTDVGNETPFGTAYKVMQERITPE